MFDVQVLSNPAEELSKARQTATGSSESGAQRHQQFDAPALIVKLGVRQGRHLVVIAKKDQLLARVGIDKADASQRPRKILACFAPRRLYDLIAAHAATEGFRVRTKAREALVIFCSRDEEGSGVGDLRQPREVHVRAVEQVECAGFENERVQLQHVMGMCYTHFDFDRNRPPQVELCVQLAAGFGRKKIGPQKKLQGQSIVVESTGGRYPLHKKVS